jgi:xanthine dehydrogenase accessory factor
MVKEHLIASGYPEDRVNRVHMPIGLEIGGETPEEIAVSIAAQLVEARRGRSRWLVPPTSTVGDQNLLSRMFDYLDEGQPCVVATVVRTVGSTPRKAGARMLLLPDGGSVGTIGGGCGEAAVRSEAMMLFDAGGARLVRVVMDADAAADEGMACGGTMDVFLERLA